jgi:phospholipase C
MFLMAEMLTFWLLLQPTAMQAQTTPIKHLVVIFQENISFDHYFGTYPYATNPKGEPVFVALPGTPTVNGLGVGLLTNNPNLNPANLSGAVNPFRLDRSQAATADQDHNYMPEQQAFHAGLMDLFPLSVGTADATGSGPELAPAGSPLATTGLTMGYFDGNTVTAMWNYAQRFAMSDNSYGTTFGPSTPGAINLISGQTNGAVNFLPSSGPANNSALVADGNGGWTDIGDGDPYGDICSTSSKQLQMTGPNVGDLLTTAGVTWGFFEGGFNLSIKNSNGTTGCGRSTTSAVTGMTESDYIQHHEPFQFYPSTANPNHTRPTSVSTIGHNIDAANHQYDILDFFAAVSAGNYPAVSFLKAPGYQDGHAGYSDPLDEQAFVVQVINFLQQSSNDWQDTAVVIAYDDSDGWYDHQMSPIVNQSATTSDALSGTGSCGAGTLALAGVASGTMNAQGRCGHGPRLPLLVISPWAKFNFVDHTATDQSSILRFIEDNWLSSQRIPGSFDALAGSLNNMFLFNYPVSLNGSPYILSQTTGECVECYTSPALQLSALGILP